MKMVRLMGPDPHLRGSSPLRLDPGSNYSNFLLTNIYMILNILRHKLSSKSIP